MNKKIYIAVGALALILAGILLIAVQRKKGTTHPEAAAESAAASAQTQKKERTATMIWWGAYDLEINSGGTRMLLNPYKNFYRKGDYIVSSMNDKTSANSVMIEMIAQVSPDLKAIILQQRRADAKQQDNIVFDPNYPALSAKLKPLCKVLEVGGTYEDANLALTAIPVDMGENVLLIKDKNSGLRFVYAATVESEPTKGVAKALELAKEPVDYLFADLTRFPQNEIRRILYESHPKHLVPLAYPYEVAGIINEQSPDVSTDLPVLYGAHAGETIESVPLRRYDLPHSLKDMNKRYLPRFLGPIKRFLKDNPLVGTRLVAPKPGEEINLLSPVELEDLPKEDEQPTRVPTTQQPDYTNTTRGLGLDKQ